MQFKFTVSPISPMWQPTVLYPARRCSPHLSPPLTRTQGGSSHRPPGTFLREREEGQGKSRSVRNTAYTAERTASRSRRFTPTSTACRHRQMDCRVPQNPIVESFPSQKPGLAGPRRGRTPASRSTTTPLPERAALRDLPVQAVWKEGEEFGLGSARSSVGWSWRCGLAGGRGR